MNDDAASNQPVLHAGLQVAPVGGADRGSGLDLEPDPFVTTVEDQVDLGAGLGAEAAGRFPGRTYATP